MGRWKKTLIVVSRDRDFLNFVSTDVIHLHNEKIHFYRGDFEAFESRSEKKCKETNKMFEVYEKQLKAAKHGGSKTTKRKGKGKTVDDDEEVVEAPNNGEIIVWSFTFQNLQNSHHLFFRLLKLVLSIPGERISNLVMSMWVLTCEQKLQLLGPMA